ncbi:class I SAM-dependent methyltransferase [Streptomyces uncialis]|uniref:class I SAM-dependent methyltransferase n=1 Tax=Streptomyces uncialis TaxID=1048205 RepID=UPI002E32722B|nr:class I SAM-dependent methyltransferase [Streptomyces uncialis]
MTADPRGTAAHHRDGTGPRTGTGQGTGPTHPHWRDGGPRAYTDAGDAWAHAADDVMAVALAESVVPGAVGTGAAGRRTAGTGTAGARAARTEAAGTGTADACATGTGRGTADAGPPGAGTGSAADAWAHRAGAGVTGSRVLDVGTGSGPAALAAARAGATAVGLDREPGLLRLAGDRARDTGLGGRTRFVAGDATALPFATDSFDVVVSTFGVMFAPDPVGCAAELVRVCRPGGLVAVASWTPDGVMGRIAPTVTRRLPAPPSGPVPTRWGDPEHVRPWFAPLSVTVRTRVCGVRVAYPSVAAAVRVFENKPGPLRAHRAALEAAGRWTAARAALSSLFAEHNTATDGRLVWDVPYLLVLARVGGTAPRA